MNTYGLNTHEDRAKYISAILNRKLNGTKYTCVVITPNGQVLAIGDPADKLPNKPLIVSRKTRACMLCGDGRQLTGAIWIMVIPGIWVIATGTFK